MHSSSSSEFLQNDLPLLHSASASRSPFTWTTRYASMPSKWAGKSSACGKIAPSDTSDFAYRKLISRSSVTKKARRRRSRHHSGDSLAMALPVTAYPAPAAAPCEALHKAGFQAYVVGGAVRDLLLRRRTQGLRRRHQRHTGRSTPLHPSLTHHRPPLPDRNTRCSGRK